MFDPTFGIENLSERKASLSLWSLDTGFSITLLCFPENRDKEYKLLYLSGQQSRENGALAPGGGIY
jgi:hypothetical protein